jgi:hypothetical protein
MLQNVVEGEYSMLYPNPNMTSKSQKKIVKYVRIPKIFESEQKSPKIGRFFQTMTNKNCFLSEMHMY